MQKQIQITDDDWMPPVEDWGKVENEVYKFTFEQAKDRFNESMSVSEDITQKCQKLFVFYASFIAAVFSVSFKVKVPVQTANWAVVLYVVDLVIILYLLRNKFIPLRGDKPNESFVPNVDDKNKCQVEEEQIKLIYFHALRRYNKKIEFLDKVNVRRATIFQYTLVLSIALFVSSVIYIVYLIFHPL